MIIKGNPASNVGFWSKHLMNDRSNELAEIREISGLLSTDLPSALREMKAVADQSRCEGNFMYQANINPRENEHLTPEQWKEAVDILEKNLGLQGHQRVVIEHVKNGRQHYHVVWNRVDAETLKVADMGGNYRIHERTSRELVNRFGLTPAQTMEKSADRKSAPELWEIRAAERSGVDPVALKAELTELWEHTDSGKAFAAAVHERGYILAKGDRRDFCVVDQAGDAHSLARRLEGVKAQDVRERMVDVDRDALPTVAEARATQRSIERASETPELKGTSAEIRMAWSLTESGAAFAAAIEDRGLMLARVDGYEAAQSERESDFAKEIGRFSPRYAEGEMVIVNNFGDVYRIDEKSTGCSRAEIDKYLATVDTTMLLNVADSYQVMKEAAREQFVADRASARDLTRMEQVIMTHAENAVSPGSFSAALYRDGITIARVDEAGIEKLAEDRRAAFMNDYMHYIPNLNEGELVAINRSGGVHTLNGQKLDLDALERALTAGNRDIPSLGAACENLEADREAQAAAYERQSGEYWQDQAGRRETRDTDAHDKWSERADQDRGRIDPLDPAEVSSESALMVVDAASGVAVGLLNFVAALIEDRKGDPPTHTTPAQQAKAEQRERIAMENIRERMAKGHGLSSTDIYNLTPSHLENIRNHGDDFLRQAINSMERRRLREFDYGRERER